MTVNFSNDRSDFVDLNEIIDDLILDLRYYSDYNFVGTRIDGYEEPVALMTNKAAQALKRVADEARKDGYRLKIYDTYRPQMAVDHFVRWAEDLEDTKMKEDFYPEVNKDELFEKGYIYAQSSHSKGSTVDLTLFDVNKNEDLDVGGNFDYFGELSHPSYKGVNDVQYENRMYLRKLMMDNGFLPFETEWWHFTLKDEPYPNTFFNFPVTRK
ncbi:MAG: M15 family metallopeptidase [Erysipelotrichaceae bacterium]|nr:M15 family metallopeptidase [Erysipelotrichaceae bacterium]